MTDRKDRKATPEPLDQWAAKVRQEQRDRQVRQGQLDQQGQRAMQALKAAQVPKD